MTDTPTTLDDLEQRMRGLLADAEQRVTQSAAHGTAAALHYARGIRQGLRLAMREVAEAHRARRAGACSLPTATRSGPPQHRRPRPRCLPPTPGSR